MPFLNCQYEGEHCRVCDARMFQVAVLIDDADIQQSYRLCTDCVGDEKLVAKIRRLEAEYAEMERLPSWWQCLWMPRIEATAVRVVSHQRYSAWVHAKREAKRKEARNGATSE
jgi:hypothetical protein